MITKDTKQWILMHTNDKMVTKDTKKWILMPLLKKSPSLTNQDDLFLKTQQAIIVEQI